MKLASQKLPTVVDRGRRFTAGRYVFVILSRPRGVRRITRCGVAGQMRSHRIMAIKRRTRRVVAAGAVGAATLSTLLLSTPSASAAPVVIPGVGNFDVPDQVLHAIPKGAIPLNMIPPGFQIPG